MQNIKKIYLYLVSLVSLIILVVAGIMLINLGLKTWVFPKADKNYYAYPAANCDTSGDAAPLKPGACDPEIQEKQRKADEDNRAAQKQRDAAQALAMIIVASPVFYFHWRLARKE